MERLTHEADVGVEDWEQILYRVPADPEGAYNIFDIAERWVHYDDADCGCILQDITRKLRFGIRKCAQWQNRIIGLCAWHMIQRPGNAPELLLASIVHTTRKENRHHEMRYV